MRINGRFKMVVSLLVVANLLAACGGTLSQAAPSAQMPGAQENIVVFTGIVEATTGSEWIISGQKIKLDPQISVAAGIAVGDEVKIEGNVLADGAVIARKIESSSKKEIVSIPASEASSTPGSSGRYSPDATSTPEVPVSSTAQAATNRNEVFGTVQALTETTITVDGVTYDLSHITRLTDALAVGDQVRLQLTVNADSTVTVRAVEKSAPVVDGGSGSGDGPNYDLNDGQCGSDCDGASDDHGGDHDDDHHESSCQSGCGHND